MSKKRKIFDIDNLCALAEARYSAEDVEEKGGPKDDYAISSGMGKRGEEAEERLAELSDSGRRELYNAMSDFVERKRPLFDALFSDYGEEDEDAESDDYWEDEDAEGDNYGEDEDAESDDYWDEESAYRDEIRADIETAIECDYWLSKFLKK